MKSKTGRLLASLRRCRESWMVVIVVCLVKAGGRSCRLQRAGYDEFLARSGRSQREDCFLRSLLKKRKEVYKYAVLLRGVGEARRALV
jgi:hypothetical protein